MPDKNRILLYGALAVCSALYAVPQLVNPASLPFLAAEPEAEQPEDDGFFASGFEGVAAGNAGSVGIGSPSTSHRGLAAQLEQALSRMERVGRGTTNVDGPAPAVELRLESQAEPTASASSRAREESEARARESLHSHLARHPVRGAVLGGSGSVLLLQGMRLAPGETLGLSGWSLAEVDNKGAVFVSGRQRVRADLPRGSRAAAQPAAATGTEGEQQ